MKHRRCCSTKRIKPLNRRTILQQQHHIFTNDIRMDDLSMLGTNSHNEITYFDLRKIKNHVTIMNNSNTIPHNRESYNNDNWYNIVNNHTSNKSQISYDCSSPIKCKQQHHHHYQTIDENDRLLLPLSPISVMNYDSIQSTDAVLTRFNDNNDKAIERLLFGCLSSSSTSSSLSSSLLEPHESNDDATADPYENGNDTNMMILNDNYIDETKSSEGDVWQQLLYDLKSIHTTTKLYTNDKRERRRRRRQQQQQQIQGNKNMDNISLQQRKQQQSKYDESLSTLQLPISPHRSRSTDTISTMNCSIESSSSTSTAEGEALTAASAEVEVQPSNDITVLDTRPFCHTIVRRFSTTTIYYIPDQLRWSIDHDITTLLSKYVFCSTLRDDDDDNDKNNTSNNNALNTATSKTIQQFQRRQLFKGKQKRQRRKDPKILKHIWFQYKSIKNRIRLL